MTNQENRYLQLAENFYKNHENLIIPSCLNQHSELREHLNELRDQNDKGLLDPEIKNKYDELGMVWKDAEQQEWNHCYNLVKQYHQLFGTLTMPRTFEMGGIPLYKWLEEQKEAYQKQELSLNRVQKLDKVDVEWVEKTYKQISFPEKALGYYLEKVFPDVVETYTPQWLNGRELDFYIPSLNVGIEYDGGRYHNKNLDKDLTKNGLCEDHGTRLIRVRDSMAVKMQSTENCTVIRQRENSNNGLNRAIRKVFAELGISNMPSVNCERDQYNILNSSMEDITYFNQYLGAARMFYKEKGHLFVPKNYTDPTGIKLGQWINNIRESQQFLSEKQINSLDEVGMVWESVNQEKWLYNLDKVKSYKEIPEYETTVDGRSLKDWFEKQKYDFENYSMYDDYKLEAMKSLQKSKTKSKNNEYEL